MVFERNEEDDEPQQWTKVEIGIALVVAFFIIFLIAQMYRSWFSWS